MKSIRVHFCDFYDGHVAEDGIAYRLLAKHFDIELTNDKPDYVICSVFPGRKNRYGLLPIHEHFLYRDAIKIMITGENIIPDLNACDYAIGFDHLSLGDRYLRAPLYAWYPRYTELFEARPPISLDDLRARQHFCNFTFSNMHAMPIRDAFFNALNAQKPVISTGPHLRNSDALVDIETRLGPDMHAAKLALLQDCKFDIAFENTKHDGYTTEKLLQPLLSRCLPIYFGNPRVAEDFNPAAYVNGIAFDDIDKLVAEVLRLDQDDDAYLAKLNANPILAGQTATQNHLTAMGDFLCEIVERPKEDARRRPLHGYAGAHYTNYAKLAHRVRRKRWWRR